MYQKYHSSCKCRLDKSLFKNIRAVEDAILLISEFWFLKPSSDFSEKNYLIQKRQTFRLGFILG